MPGVRGKFKSLGNSQNKEMAAPPKGVPESPHRDDQADARQSDRDYRASEEWRAICEARWVIAKPLADRRQYLVGVGEKRGAAARKYLEGVILQEWKKKATPKSG